MCPSVKEQVTIPLGIENMYGMFHKCQTTAKAPAILILHGFASNRSGKFRLSYELAQKLNSKGIHVLRIDMRGCGDSDRDFSEMSPSTLIEDGLTAVNWLKNHPAVDQSRIGILGRSLGGAIAVYSAKDVKSLALWAPFFSNDQWSKEGAVKSEEIVIDGHIPGEAFIREIATFSVEKPLLELKKVPIFFVFPGKDQVLDLTHRKKYLKELKKIDRVFNIEGADHTFTNPNDRKLLVDETIKWFMDTL